MAVGPIVLRPFVAGSCWMLDSDADLGPGWFGETEKDFERNSEDICKAYIVIWGVESAGLSPQKTT